MQGSVTPGLETTVSRPYEIGWNDVPMGYYCVLFQIRERSLMDLDEDQVPRLFERVGHPERRGTSLRILSQYEHPAMAGEPVPPISLEKMDLALHHLLTGGVHPVQSPLSRAILGGRPIGAALGIGPARYLWANEVREISTALSSLMSEDLRQRYDPAGLKADRLSTQVSWDEDEEFIFTGLEYYFELLTVYYRIAAARANAMLIGVI
jgi:Domain of unknown function (DUF1877)